MKIISIEESYKLCGVDRDLIVHFIQEEWIHPADEESMGLDEEDIARIRLIHDLKEQFGVNDEGMSIILHLVDQLNRIHLEIEKHHSKNP